ncbi:hypothetical protein [Campylobacter sp.]|uniref:hypothetical protein n=2 Tax=Campylobacter TaxID=194 RepID=UPI0025BA7353|nr:hypothetical protein [Campylobacter sp.]
MKKSICSSMLSLAAVLALAPAQALCNADSNPPLIHTHNNLYSAGFSGNTSGSGSTSPNGNITTITGVVSGGTDYSGSVIYGGGSGDGIAGFTELNSASNNRLTIRGTNAYVGIAIGAEAKGVSDNYVSLENGSKVNLVVGGQGIAASKTGNEGEATRNQVFVKYGAEITGNADNFGGSSNRHYNIIGGRSGADKKTSSNAVTIDGGTIGNGSVTNVIVGGIVSGSGDAVSNRITIKGGTFRGSFDIFGAQSSTGKSSYNSVNITVPYYGSTNTITLNGSGRIWGAAGGSGSSSANSVSISAKLKAQNYQVVGGQANSASVMSANRVEINNDDVIVGSVTGSLGGASSSRSVVDLYKGTVKGDVAAASGIAGESDGDRVTLGAFDSNKGVHIGGNVYGARAGSVKNAVVYINKERTTIAGDVYAGYATSGSVENSNVNFRGGTISGTIYGSNKPTDKTNTLHIENWVGGGIKKAKDIKNFGSINFHDLYSTTEADAPLTLTTSGNTNLNGTKIEGIKSDLGEGKYYLIHNSGSGTITRAAQTVQDNQIYTITDKDHYQITGTTIEVENNKNLIMQKGTLTRSWIDPNFDQSELMQNQNSNKAAGATELFGNKGNTVIIKENAGNLGGKNISSGRDDATDGSNSVHDNYAKIKGGSSIGEIDGGYSNSATPQEIYNNHVTFEASGIDVGYVNAGITHSSSGGGNVHDNSVTTNATIIRNSIYGGNTSNGEAKSNIVTINNGSVGAMAVGGKGNSAISNTITLNSVNVGGSVYGGKASGTASSNTVNLNGNTQVAGNVYAAEAASGSNNVVNFRSGSVAGTIYGVSSANASNSGNSLNILSSNSGNGLNARNFANFNKLEFNLASLSEIENDASSSTKKALSLTGSGNTDLSGTDIFVNSSNEFNALNNASYPDGDNKKYTLAYKSGGGKFTGYDPRFKDKGYVTQLNKNYVIKDANTFSRNIGGMHISEDERELYIQKLIKTNESINGDFDADELQKYLGAGGLNGNNIDIGKAGEDKNFNARNIHAAGANNTLNFISGHNVGVISASGSGNTLNIGASNSSPAAVNSLSAKNISGFDRLNFFLPSSIRAGDSVLTLSDPTANTDLSNVSNITAYISGVSGPLSPSSEIHLINKQGSGSLITPNAANMHATLNVGVSLSYSPKIYQSGNYLNLGFDASSAPSARVSSNTKSFAETRAASLASLKSGSELITNYLDKLIPDGHLELFPFAISEAYDLRYETGSHVNSKGYGVAAGLASLTENFAGDILSGVFVEYGKANYDSYLDSGLHADGDSEYIGGGLMLKQNFTSGTYLDASFHVGKISSDYNSNDWTYAIAPGVLAHNEKFDISSTYMATHIGIGQIFDLSQSNKLDVYTKWLYAYTDDADATISSGERYHFDSVTSNRVRAGIRDTINLKDEHNLYVGGAYEYEFKGDAKASTMGLDAPKPSLKGSTGVFEAGYKYDSKNLILSLGGKGYVGKTRGAAINAGFEIMF